MTQTLIVYRCYDNHEEEACFLVADHDAAKAFLDRAPPRPAGFEDRDGYYFFEDVGANYTSVNDNHVN